MQVNCGSCSKLVSLVAMLKPVSITAAGLLNDKVLLLLRNKTVHPCSAAMSAVLLIWSSGLGMLF